MFAHGNVADPMSSVPGRPGIKAAFIATEDKLDSAVFAPLPAYDQVTFPDPSVVNTCPPDPSLVGKVNALPTFKVPPVIIPVVVKSCEPRFNPVVAPVYGTGAVTVQFVDPGAQEGFKV